MRHGVRADGDDAWIERPQLLPSREVELMALTVGRLEARRGTPDAGFDSPPARDVEGLHPFDEGFHLGGCPDARGELGESFLVERDEALPGLVIPQPLLAIDQPRADEKGRREAELLQDRISDFDVVAQAVVEGQRDARAGAFSAAGKL